MAWFKGAPKEYLALFEDANHERVRSDLRTFFGPRADIYLAIYEKMRPGAPGHTPFPRTWNWTVFLTTFPWFFYRKMYAVGSVVVLIPVVLGLFGVTAGMGGAMAGLAIVAKTIYVQAALHRLLKVDALGLTGAEREDYLRRAGGVSVVAGVLAGILFAAMVGLAILAITIDPKSVR
jgi:hypothetical protein